MLFLAFLPWLAKASSVPRLARCSIFASLRRSSFFTAAEGRPRSSATGAVLIASTLETTGNAAVRAAAAAGAEDLMTTGAARTGPDDAGLGTATGPAADTPYRSSTTPPPL